MIAIGIQNPGDGRRVTTNVPFFSAFQSTMNIVFSYAGHVSFFGFISEMREPKDYPKTLYTLQFTDTSLYLTAAVVIYYYGGDSVTSPALGSTSPLVAKIAYGIAIPTKIVIAGIIYCQVAGKYIYVRIFRGTDNMHKRTFKSIGTWVGLVTTLWILAWIIASAVPVFNNLLSLIVALFASWFTFGLNGFFWLFLFWGRWFESPKKIFLTIANFIIIGIGACLCGVGLYVTGKAIHESEKTGAFSCANNA
ncbi:hypothetical protein PHISP_03788 [Aspergillus sp. HF37]|nr:hypothetical protein PHISP_03788 [Aspergillus sp. HF37]